MPFYDLYCPDCGKELKIFASMAEKAEKSIACPECGSQELETVFKGSPAYIMRSNSSASECPHRHVCGEGCSHAS
jgi:putative FmdB family regulatory protein